MDMALIIWLIHLQLVIFVTQCIFETCLLSLQWMSSMCWMQRLCGLSSLHIIMTQAEDVPSLSTVSWWITWEEDVKNGMRSKLLFFKTRFAFEMKYTKQVVDHN